MQNSYLGMHTKPSWVMTNYWNRNESSCNFIINNIGSFCSTADEYDTSIYERF